MKNLAGPAKPAQRRGDDQERVKIRGERRSVPIIEGATRKTYAHMNPEMRRENARLDAVTINRYPWLNALWARFC